MKEFHVKVLAKHYDPESCAVDRKVNSEALTGAHAGRVLSSEIRCNQGADAVGLAEGNMRMRAMASTFSTLRNPETSSMYGNSKHENREALTFSIIGKLERCMKARRPKIQMDNVRESDKLIVPMKQGNK